MNPESFAQLTAILTLLGTGLGTVVLLFREARTRRWLEKDRALEREAATAEREELARKLEAERQQSDRQLRGVAVGLHKEIAATKKAASDAYREANHVKDTIADLNQQLVVVAEQTRKTSDETLTMATDIRDEQRAQSDVRDE